MEKDNGSQDFLVCLWVKVFSCMFSSGEICLTLINTTYYYLYPIYMWIFGPLGGIWNEDILP